ncbi:MAG TPA: cytochrome P450 [Deltaproteobacteria bacterium]|nr:cytochrome P450 [Deltaproteobacteria bacterium]
MDFNPLSPEARANPYPGYEWLRREAPVHELEPFGVFALSRHSDILAALKSPEIFSSSGMRAMMSGQTGMMGSTTEPGRMGQITQANSLISSDGEIHDRLRAVVNRGFTPRRIAELEPRVRKVTAEAIDSIASAGEMDLVRDLAIPVPVRMIADILGVPGERLRDFKRWSDAIIESATGVGQDDRAREHFKAREEFLAFFDRAIEARRKSPGGDLISTLVRAEGAEDGSPSLSPDEVLSFTVLLLIAGNETTTNLIGNTLLALTDHPDQMEKVCANPGLIPNLVEEALRFDSPVQAIFRQTTRDVDVAGTMIPEGKLVMLLLGSANRDEDWLPNADRFDVTRELKGHIGFGFGVHFCLGASLARLEARVALETLLSRCRRIERTTETVEWIDSLILRGPKSLPLRFDA